MRLKKWSQKRNFMLYRLKGMEAQLTRMSKSKISTADERAEVLNMRYALRGILSSWRTETACSRNNNT